MIQKVSELDYLNIRMLEDYVPKFDYPNMRVIRKVPEIDCSNFKF